MRFDMKNTLKILFLPFLLASIGIEKTKSASDLNTNKVLECEAKNAHDPFLNPGINEQEGGFNDFTYNGPLTGIDDLVINPKLRVKITVFKANFSWINGLNSNVALAHLKYGLYTSNASGMLIDKITEGYTDDNGDATVKLFDYGFNGTTSVSFVLFAQTKTTSVRPYGDSSGVSYRVVFDAIQNVADGKTYTRNYSYYINDRHKEAMQIATCLGWGEKYAEEMDGNTPNSVYVQYPHPEKTAYSSAGYMMIMESDYFDWDVILHEYGHHLTYWLGMCQGQGGLQHDFLDDYSNRYSKKKVLECAWKESWPTVYALAVTKRYYSYLENVCNVNDNEYDDNPRYIPHHAYSEDIEDAILAEDMGEACELSQEAVLFDLFDLYDSSESFDRISLGHQAFWDLMKSSKSAKTFSDFVKYIYQNECLNLDDFALLLENYGFAVKTRHVDQKFTTNNRPKLSWWPSGNVLNDNLSENENGSVTGNTKCVTNSFDLIFYSADGTKLFTKTNVRSPSERAMTSYELTQSQWNQILAAPGSYYKVQFEAKSTLGDLTTGPYKSTKMSFPKSQTIFETINPSDVVLENVGLDEVGLDNDLMSLVVDKVYHKNVSKVTNNRGVEWFNLFPGLYGQDHEAYLEFELATSVSSLSFDCTFRTNRSDRSTSTFKIYKKVNDSYILVHTADLDSIPMDISNGYKSLTINFNANVSDIKIVFTGYGYSGMCLKDIALDTRIV